MPEYLAPGVFVEEASFRAKSLGGVGTSVAASVGPTRFGPLRGKPEVVTSFGEFTRLYGDIQNLNIGGASVLNHTAIAAKAFFDGGGKQLYVSRVGNFATPTTGFASAADAGAAVTFRSRFPGTMGNFTLEVNWKDSENLLRSEVTSAPTEDEVVYLQATGLTAANLANVTLPGGLGATLSVRALVQRDDANYDIVSPNLIVSDGTITATVAAGGTSQVQVPDLTGRTLRFTDVTGPSGIAVTSYGMGVAAGDVDNDGFVDLYRTGLSGSVLLHNNGNGTLSDVTAKTGVGNPGGWGV